MSNTIKDRRIFTSPIPIIPGTTISSTGSGTSLVVSPDKVKSLIAGNNITITDNGNDVTIATTSQKFTVVANYSALPDPTTVSGKFYWVSNSQGTKWLPGALGGTYYDSGVYYSNGTTWEYTDIPYNATQAEVNTGTNNDKFVTPNTLTNATVITNKGVLANPLSQFASTTSAQLRGVLSDENGTGAALFDGAINASLVTPNLGTPSTLVLTNATGLSLTSGTIGILPISMGGTNNNSFITNGVTYYSGTQLKTLATFTFDGSKLGVGVTTADSELTVSKQTTIFTPPTGTLVHLVGLDANSLRIALDTHNNASSGGTAFLGRRSRGTAAIPSATLSGDTILSMNGVGFGTTVYGAVSTGLITIKANQDFTDSAMGTYITIFTTPDGSIAAAEAARVTGSGILNLIQAAGAYQINSTSVLNSTTLGSGVISSSLTSFGNSPNLITPTFNTSTNLLGTTNTQIVSSVTSTGTTGNALIYSTNSTNGSAIQMQSWGSASPGTVAALNVTGMTALRMSPSTGGIGIIVVESNFPLILATNNIERARITATGGLGINTTGFTTNVPLMISANSSLRDASWGGAIEIQSTVGNPNPSIIFGNQSGTSRLAGISWTTSTSGNNNTSEQGNLFIEQQGTVGELHIRLNPNIGTSISSDILVLNASSGITSNIDFKLGVVGKGFYIKEGTNACMGLATLASGSVVVNTSKVTVNSRIFLTINSTPSGTAGFIRVSARTAATSFTISSSSVTDASTVAWEIKEPA